MPLNKKDFIEIEFTAKTKEGEIFDTNVKEELEKLHAGHDHPVEAEPFTFCIGESMFMPAIEEFLVGKPDTPATYTIELPAEKAFGKRDAKLIQRMPLKVFKDQNLNPVPGYAFNFDGRVGRVLASSGGRVIVDFNNPVAGKDVVYMIKVLKKVTGLNEKAKALIKFLFRYDFKFEIKDKKIILEVPKQLSQFTLVFKDKFKDLLGLELEVKEMEEKPESAKSEEKPEASVTEKQDSKKPQQ